MTGYCIVFIDKETICPITTTHTAALEVGHPKLREHLASVTTLMRATSTWEKFMRFF